MAYAGHWPSSAAAFALNRAASSESRALLVAPRCGSGRFVWLPSSVSVRIKQYVYFALKSERVSGEAMAKKIGLAADRVKVRGSRIAQPRPKPVVHSWEILCDTAGLTVDKQIERVLDRIRPHQQAILNA